MTKVRRPKILSVSWPISPWVKKFGALEQPLDVYLTFSSPTFALFAQKWRELWQQVLHRSLASKVSLVRRCLLSYVGVSHQTSLLKHLSSQCPSTLPPHQIPSISRYGLGLVIDADIVIYPEEVVLLWWEQVLWAQYEVAGSLKVIQKEKEWRSYNDSEENLRQSQQRDWVSCFKL